MREGPGVNLLVKEIFHSLQGETSQSGLRFAFIRLTGCNLRCTYCDSAYAFQGGRTMKLDEVMTSIEEFRVKDVLITGGEPLLQKGTTELVRCLREKDYRVSIETHGEISIAEVVRDARIILDIKTPASGMSGEGFKSNLPLLKPTDEVKFVIASPEDYTWARTLIESHVIPTREILLSPAVAAPDAPGKFPGVSPEWLASRILEDRLDVRMQLQLHKQIWGAERTGV